MFLFLVFMIYIRCLGSVVVNRLLLLFISVVVSLKLVVCSCDIVCGSFGRCISGIVLVLFLVMCVVVLDSVSVVFGGNSRLVMLKCVVECRIVLKLCGLFILFSYSVSIGLFVGSVFSYLVRDSIGVCIILVMMFLWWVVVVSLLRLFFFIMWQLMWLVMYYFSIGCRCGISDLVRYSLCSVCGWCLNSVCMVFQLYRCSLLLLWFGGGGLLFCLCGGSGVVCGGCVDGWWVFFQGLFIMGLFQFVLMLEVGVFDVQGIGVEDWVEVEFFLLFVIVQGQYGWFLYDQDGDDV